MANTAPSPGQRNLIFGHINAHSLPAHRQDLQALILRTQPLAFGISESFLTPSDSSLREQIPEYTFFRHDRLGTRCGGVALYVHKSARCKIVDTSARPEEYRKAPEFILAEIAFERLKFLCVVVYSPPKAGFWHHVEEAILYCNSAYDRLILMGDLNIEWHTNTTNRRILAQSLQILGLTPVPFGTTHHLDHSNSTIDYICVPKACMDFSYWQQHLPWISAHDAVFVSFPVLISRVSRPKTITRRSYRNFDINALWKDLREVDWSEVTSQTDIDERVRLLTAYILGLYDKHAPMRTFVPRKDPSPWLTPALRSLRNARNKAWDTYRENKSRQNKDRYKQLRNHVKSEFRKASIAYYNKKSPIVVAVKKFGM